MGWFYSTGITSPAIASYWDKLIIAMAASALIKSGKLSDWVLPNHDKRFYRIAEPVLFAARTQRLRIINGHPAFNEDDFLINILLTASSEITHRQ